ncbi:MAG TPA: hypothetical protein VFD42_03780, partial [Chloroflexota bacterium]|nr:hypothetical protein [Chloroflexota bacterium]
HCEGCGRRFRPAESLLSCLEGGNVSAKLREAAVLAGTSWPYAVAANVLADLCGATISGETVRRLTNAAGANEAERQTCEAERVLCPTGEQMRQERETVLGEPLTTAGGGPALLPNPQILWAERTV